MSIRAFFAANDGGDDSYHSDGGDAVAQQRALTNWWGYVDSKAHGTNWWGYVAPCNYNK
jgi:hypothetical protein